MLVIYEIPTMADHKLALYTYKVVQQYLGSLQTRLSTPTNHSEIIALYEASRERVWLRRMINHILQLCGIGATNTPTIIFEDNSACVTQMESCYIKSNMTKHIIPKLFYPP